MGFDFKSILGAVAPTIATAMLGPLGGMAVKAIGDALGMDSPTQDKIEEAFKGGQLTGDQIVALKNADKALAIKFKELDIDADKLVFDDKKSAREMQTQTRSKIPGYLAVAITAGFFGILTGMMFGFLKTSGNSEALLILLGALSTSFGAIVQFYFGSSKGSEDKNAAIMQAVANNGNGKK